jgi:pimeloyl-ACP methyl ester carboxylesterase
MSASDHLAAIARHFAGRDGVDAIVFAGHRPRRAVISFTSMNPGKFERWGWFHDRHEAGCNDLYMVIKDESQHYYLGTEDNPQEDAHARFLLETLSAHGVPPSHAYLAGGSMGGYAAIYYAFSLGLGGAIAVNPQADMESAKLHKFRNWQRQMGEMGKQWIDLDRHIARTIHRPLVHINHGQYPADLAAAARLKIALEAHGVPHRIQTDTAEEHGSASLTQSLLFKIINSWTPPARQSPQLVTKPR